MDEIVHSKMVIHFGKYVTKWHQWDPMIGNCNSIRKISSKIVRNYKWDPRIQNLGPNEIL
jgi:hypothetical protein